MLPFLGEKLNDSAILAAIPKSCKNIDEIIDQFIKNLAQDEQQNNGQSFVICCQFSTCRVLCQDDLNTLPDNDWFHGFDFAFLDIIV